MPTRGPARVMRKRNFGFGYDVFVRWNTKTKEVTEVTRSIDALGIDKSADEVIINLPFRQEKDKYCRAKGYKLFMLINKTTDDIVYGEHDGQLVPIVDWAIDSTQFWLMDCSPYYTSTWKNLKIVELALDG